MIRYLAFALALFFAAPADAGWFCNHGGVCVPDGHTTILPNGTIMNDNGAVLLTVQSVQAMPPDLWTGYAGYPPDIDLTKLGIDPSAIAVHLHGIEIITGGTQEEDCNLTFTFKSTLLDDNTTFSVYQWQATTVSPAGGTATGVRQPAGVLVPVANHMLRWAWGRGDSNTGSYPGGTIPAWPTGCAYGALIYVDWYLLP